jgi:hypothetical protein
MFQDIGVSKNLIDEYRTSCESKDLKGIGKITFDDFSQEKFV